MNIQAKKTMVCVTVQTTCERLIREGAKLAGDEGLLVVHVVKENGTVLGSDNDSTALEYLFQVSRSFGAQMDMLRSRDVLETLVTFAKKNAVKYIVLGAPAERNQVDFGALLRQRLPAAKVFVLPPAG